MLCRIKADFQAKKFMKKFISFLATIVLVFSISAICANAFYIPDDSESCTIKSTQSESMSNYVVGKNKYVGAQNYSSSKHKLTVSAMYYDGNGYIYDVRGYVGIGDDIQWLQTSNKTDPVSWKVKLAPFGIYTSGCNGQGFVWHH